MLRILTSTQRLPWYSRVRARTSAHEHVQIDVHAPHRRAPTQPTKRRHACSYFITISYSQLYQYSYDMHTQLHNSFICVCSTRRGPSYEYACLNFSTNIGLIFTDFVATCQFSPRTAKCCALLCDRSVCCTCDAGAHRGLHTAHCSHSLTGELKSKCHDSATSPRINPLAKPERDCTFLSVPQYYSCIRLQHIHIALVGGSISQRLPLLPRPRPSKLQ
jgi:hypothetical protein